MQTGLKEVRKGVGELAGPKHIASPEEVAEVTTRRKNVASVVSYG